MNGLLCAIMMGRIVRNERLWETSYWLSEIMSRAISLIQCEVWQNTPFLTSGRAQSYGRTGKVAGSKHY